jgi:hypothetical protein
MAAHDHAGALVAQGRVVGERVQEVGGIELLQGTRREARLAARTAVSSAAMMAPRFLV